MSKTFVVIGATGKQGGSVINFVLADAELSKTYTLRAVTRDKTSSAALALVKKGVEVVQADVDDSESLKVAFHGAWGAFVMTLPVEFDSVDKELNQAKAIADAAVAAQLKYIVFSTLPHVFAISGGQITSVTPFDAKALAEDYIRTLPIQSAFYMPSGFMSNYRHRMAPRPAGDGTHVIHGLVRPDAYAALVDDIGDTGKFVGAVLAAPEALAGATLSAATPIPYTLDEIAATIGRATGRIVRYQQVPEDVFRGFFPPGFADVMVGMMKYIDQYGYFGPSGQEKVEWSAKQARGKLTTFEEYLAKNPLVLE